MPDSGDSNGWRPIETAPRGEEIEVRNGKAIWRGWVMHPITAYANSLAARQATHWRPAPPAPEDR